MAIAQECYPENRAMANGVYMMLVFVIQSIIMVVFGGISDAIGMHKDLTVERDPTPGQFAGSALVPRNR
jgi:hypothetical protein